MDHELYQAHCVQWSYFHGQLIHHLRPFLWQVFHYDVSSSFQYANEPLSTLTTPCLKRMNARKLREM